MSLSHLWQTYGPLVRTAHFRTVAATGALILAAWIVALAGVAVPYLAEIFALAAVGIGGLGIVWGRAAGPVAAAGERGRTGQHRRDRFGACR